MFLRVSFPRPRPQISPTADTETLLKRLQHLADRAFRPARPAADVTQLDRQAAVLQIAAQVSDGARTLTGLAAVPDGHVRGGQDTAFLDAAVALYDALSVLCTAAVTTVNAPVTTPLTVTTLPR